MTPEELAAIAARNAARTQGKWQAVALGNDDYPSEVWFADNMRVCLMPSNTGQRKPKDADFIAHASEDIPSLLSEVARLTAEKQEAEQRGYDAAKEQAKQQVRYDCQACSGTGHADAETECEYCGRPMQSIAAMVRP